ncbi:MAG: hypothetical protein EXS63_03460 [Candidatus Omnitrophica bacterium]|nr:hypothetical protein [Candidatus Omnitrophota bacterium]
MNETTIQLLQFMICRNFQGTEKDVYTAEGIHSNLYAPLFPHRFDTAHVVTCWRKDQRFHKEVIEYCTDYGETIRTAPMDVEPVTNSVLFRWHKHHFPSELVIEKPCLLTIRVVLDWKVHFESYIMIEAAPESA